MPTGVVGHDCMCCVARVKYAGKVEVSHLDAPLRVTHKIWGLDVAVQYLGTVLVQLIHALHGQVGADTVTGCYIGNAQL